MHRASDRVEHEEWIDDLERTAEALDLSDDAASIATDLFLSAVPDADRSKPAIVAASLYAGALVVGDQRSQSEIADAADVSRLAVQKHWKPLLATAGFDAPEW